MERPCVCADRAAVVVVEKVASEPITGQGEGDPGERTCSRSECRRRKERDRAIRVETHRPSPTKTVLANGRVGRVERDLVSARYGAVGGIARCALGWRQGAGTGRCRL